MVKRVSSIGHPFLFAMKKLPALIDSWNTPAFEAELQQALKQLKCTDLPLKQAAHFSGVFVEDTLQVSSLNARDEEQCLIMKLSVFFQEISNLCPCSGDEPETVEGHCEMQMTINKSDGLVGFSVL